MQRKAMFTRIIMITLMMFAMFIVFEGCEKNSMSSNDKVMLSDVPVENSSTGPISLLQVQPEIQREIEKQKHRLCLQKTTSAEDSSLFYVEVFGEQGKDVKLEIKNDKNGNSKVEIKKENLPQDITVVFIWAENAAYEGELYSPDYSGEVVFNEPAKVELAYKNADWTGVRVENLGFYQFNEATDTWEKLESDIGDEKLEVYITKFGKFKIFHEMNGSVLTDFFMLPTNVFFTKKFIKEQKGGKLQVGSKRCGNSRIKFNKYDLPEDLEIEFKWAADGSVSGLLSNMKFGPHGITFRHPIEVELSYRMADLSGCDETKLTVYYYNEEEDIWEFIGGEVDIKNKKIKVYLNHFSRYAVAYGR